MSDSTTQINITLIAEVHDVLLPKCGQVCKVYLRGSSADYKIATLTSGGNVLKTISVTKIVQEAPNKVRLDFYPHILPVFPKLAIYHDMAVQVIRDLPGPLEMILYKRDFPPGHTFPNPFFVADLIYEGGMCRLK